MGRVMIPSSTISFVGACPFGGVILLSTFVYGIQGTFCNDGNFVLPLHKKIYLSNVLIIRYSVDQDFDLKYTYTQPAGQTVLTITKNQEFSLELHTYSTILSLCSYGIQYGIAESYARTSVHGCLFAFFYYTYYRPHPDVISFESMTGYVVTVIEHASGKCLSEQTNTTVVFEYEDGHAMSSNRCGGIMSDYSDNIKNIKIYLWFTDFVSVLRFKDMDIWHFNMKVKGHMQSNSDINASYKGLAQYYIMGHSGSFSMQTTSTTVVINLKKLPPQLFDIVVNGSGTETGDSPFGMSLIVDTHMAHVEIFYITTKLTLTIDIQQHTKKKSLHILKAARFRLEYKKRILAKYHHFHYDSGCEFNYSSQGNFFLCTKLINLAASLTREKLLWGPRTFIGSYDVNRKDFFHTEAHIYVIESYIGPVQISANEAAEACRQTGTKFLQTEIFGYWITGFQTSKAYNFSQYAYVSWHTNFTGQKSLHKQHIDMNCKNIDRLFKLQYYRYSLNNKSSSQSGSIHSLMLYGWLLRLNKDTPQDKQPRFWLPSGKESFRIIDHQRT